jgi:transposase
MGSGRSARWAAATFGVSVASAVRWSQRHRRSGHVRPGKVGGHRKPVLLPERAWLHARLSAEPDLTLRALLAELHDRGVKASYGALWLFLEREGLSFKKKRARQRAGAALDRKAAGPVAEVSGPA